MFPLCTQGFLFQKDGDPLTPQPSLSEEHMPESDARKEEKRIGTPPSSPKSSSTLEADQGLTLCSSSEKLQKQSFVRRPFLLWEKERTCLFCWILLHHQAKNLTCSACNDIFFFNSIFVLKIPPEFVILKRCYRVLSCAPTPWKRLGQDSLDWRVW